MLLFNLALLLHNTSYVISFLSRRRRNSKKTQWLPSLWIHTDTEEEKQTENRQAYVMSVVRCVEMEREAIQTNFINQESVLSQSYSEIMGSLFNPNERGRWSLRLIKRRVRISEMSVFWELILSQYCSCLYSQKDIRATWMINQHQID